MTLDNDYPDDPHPEGHNPFRSAIETDDDMELFNRAIIITCFIILILYSILLICLWEFMMWFFK